MSKRSIFVLAGMALLLASGAVWGAGTIRDTFVAMHGGDAHAAQKSASGPVNARLAERARQWVAAFSAGDDAMRAFLTDNLSMEALKERPVERRMDGYRTLRKRFGTLKAKAARATGDSTVEMTLITKDGSEREFIFTGESKPPFKLHSIGYRETRHGH